MLTITKYERQIIIFLIFLTFLGISVLYYRKDCFIPSNKAAGKFNCASEIINKDLRAIDEKILLSKRIDINNCNVDELIKLPGIGPNLAGRIIEYRRQNGNFEKTEDILNVKGIGHSRLEKMRDFIEIN